MPKTPRVLPALAALLGLVSVACGAFAAHALKDPVVQNLFRIGGQYGMVHAVAAFAALFMLSQGRRMCGVAAWLFVAGGWIFSLSLYALAISGFPQLGALTPLGGAAMIAGWAVLAVCSLIGPKSA